MPFPSMAIGANGGVLVSLGLLVLGVVTLLWNKVDKRFDDLEAREDKRFDDLKAEQNQQFGEVKAEIRELRALVQDALTSPR